MKEIIPAFVLHKWDFKKYNVSKFGKEMIDSMMNENLFHIASFNQNLYQLCKDLRTIRNLRTQLFIAKDFILSCKDGQKCLELVKEKQVENLLTSIEVYSLQNLLDVKNGLFL